MVKIEEMLQLMEAVNKNGLTCVKLEDGETKVVIEKKHQAVITNTVKAEEISSYNYTEPAKEDTASLISDKIVTSPLVGIFYSATAPGEEPLIKAGDTIKKGQVLGIIEAMKLMNEIESEYDGVVEAVLVDNEDTVEYGQPLFRIR